MAGPGRGAATGRAQGVEQSGASQPVIMTGQDQPGVARKPAGLIDAVSEIQQFWVIESTGQNLPSDFLTIKGSLQFMMIGAKSGFWEGFMFAILIPLTLTFTSTIIMAEIGLKKDWFFQFLLYLAAFSPITFNTILCSFLGKYYIGNLTKRAANCLMNGRSVALLFKGIIVYFVFYFLGKYITPEIVASWVHKTSFSPQTKEKIYDIMLEYFAKLPEAGAFMIITSIVAAAVPFLIVYWQDAYRRKKIEEALRALEDA